MWTKAAVLNKLGLDYKGVEEPKNICREMTEEAFNFVLSVIDKTSRDLYHKALNDYRYCLGFQNDEDVHKWDGNYKNTNRDPVVISDTCKYFHSDEYIQPVRHVFHAGSHICHFARMVDVFDHMGDIIDDYVMNSGEDKMWEW